MRRSGVQRRFELKQKAETILRRRGGKPSYMMVDPVYIIDLVEGYERLLRERNGPEAEFFTTKAPRFTKGHEERQGG